MTKMPERKDKLDQQEAALLAFINHPDVEQAYRSCERDSLEAVLAATAEDLLRRGDIPRLFSAREYADNYISAL